MRRIQIFLVLSLIMLCVACSNRKIENRLTEAEQDTSAVRTDMQVLEQRVQSVEGRLEGLTKALNSLEVKTLRGKKTNYMVVPAVESGGAALVQPAKSGDTSATSAAAAPVAMPASVTPASAVPAATTTPAAAPSSSAYVPLTQPATLPAATAPAVPSGATLSLPPTTAPLPATTLVPPVPSAAVPAGQTTQAPVSLALPPEIPTTGQEQLGNAGASGASPALAAAPVVAPAPVAAAPRASAPASAPLAPKVKGEEGAYNAALALARGGKPAEAINRFKAFLQEYPSGRYAPNAYYWIGECLYAQKQYADALLQFKEVASRYPRHHKSADALLKAGMTYSRLGDKDNATLQYKAVVADFPASEAARYVKGRGLAR